MSAQADRGALPEPRPASTEEPAPAPAELPHPVFINETTGQQKADLAGRSLREAYDSMLDPHVLYEAIRDDGGQIVDFRFVDATRLPVSTTNGTAGG